jgi:hypothetical protein
MVDYDHAGTAPDKVFQAVALKVRINRRPSGYRFTAASALALALARAHITRLLANHALRLNVASATPAATKSEPNPRFVHLM